LRFIVEGANVFFDDAARRYIATSTEIKQIKDSTANKGGVYSSSLAEVLTAFLLGDAYEEKLVQDQATRGELIRDIMQQVEDYSRAETSMLLRLHDQDPSIPLFVLSERTSEQIFDLQAVFEKHLDQLLADEELAWQILTAYIPSVLIRLLGRDRIIQILGRDELTSYRDAIITKKLAAMAFYRFGLQFDALCDAARKDLLATAKKILKN
jgi:glutamate dehydrogenase